MAKIATFQLVKKFFTTLTLTMEMDDKIDFDKMKMCPSEQYLAATIKKGFAI